MDIFHLFAPCCSATVEPQQADIVILDQEHSTSKTQQEGGSFDDAQVLLLPGCKGSPCKPSKLGCDEPPVMEYPSSESTRTTDTFSRSDSSRSDALLGGENPDEEYELVSNESFCNAFSDDDGDEGEVEQDNSKTEDQVPRTRQFRRRSARTTSRASQLGQKLRRLSQAVSRVGSSDNAKAPSGLLCVSAVEGLLAGLPAVQIPKRKEDQLFRSSQVTLNRVLDALEGLEEESILQQAFRESMDAFDIRSTPWSKVTTSGGSEAKSMVSRYSFPTPQDVPEVARRIVNLPHEVQGTTISWFSSPSCADPQDRTIMLKQRSTTEGVLYSDRVVIEMTLVFSQDPCGGVAVRQWVDTIWTRPLPWTHSFLVRIFESKVKSDTAEKFPQLRSLIERACTPWGR